jgi:hypothetical protein
MNKTGPGTEMSGAMNVTIKPIHLAIAVGAIVLTLVLLPFLFSWLSEAYPPAGTARRWAVDKCDEEYVSRWIASQREPCVALKLLTRR